MSRDRGELAAMIKDMSQQLIGCDWGPEIHVKVAELPELFTFVVQRHKPGCLTPHEARMKAEAENAKLRAELEALRTAAGESGGTQ